MSSFDERDIQELLETPPAVVPPEDLAHRLKAQIPDPLPQWDEAAPSTSPGPLVTSPEPRVLQGPWRWTTVGRLAAALVAVLGVGALSMQVLRWTQPVLDPPAAFEVASQPAETSDRDPETYRATDDIAESRQEESVSESELARSESPTVQVDEVQVSELTVEELAVEPTTAAAEAPSTPPTMPLPRAKSVPPPSHDPQARARVVASQEVTLPLDAEPLDAASYDAASMDAEASRARRSERVDEAPAARRLAPLDETKRNLQSVLSASPTAAAWTSSEARPRMTWRPTTVDVATFGSWRQRPEAQAPSMDAVLMTFGSLVKPAPEAMGLEVAPAPHGDADTYWLLVEGRPGETDQSTREGLWEIEMEPRTVTRYRFLAGGVDPASRVARFLVALQLRDSTGALEETLVKVRQVAPSADPTSTPPSLLGERTLRRQDLVADWRAGTWAYRFQTLGVGLAQAMESASATAGSSDVLLGRVRELTTESPREPDMERKDSTGKAWLEDLAAALEAQP